MPTSLSRFFDALAHPVDAFLDLLCRVKRAKPSPREQGAWGERAAARFLRMEGWKILARNIRPVWRDRRLEIDIIARHPEAGVVAMVEVKTHLARSKFAPRLWAVDRRKKNLLRAAFRAWLRKHPQKCRARFDVVEVYGSCRASTPPEIDHIKNIPLAHTGRPR